MAAFFIVLGRFFRAIRDGLREPEFRTLGVSLLVILLSGTFFYHQVEGWGWLDSFYFTVITLTTIGYGDFAPTKPISKVFTIIFIFIGLGSFSALIVLLAERVSRQQPVWLREPEENGEEHAANIEKRAG